MREATTSTSVTMCTVFEDGDKLFQCLCAGDNGYMLKNKPAGLFEAIQEVLEGGAPMSPSNARKVLKTFQHGQITNMHLLPVSWMYCDC